MRTIGITGGVGAGKSQVLALMKEHFDADVILADEVAHELMEPGGGSFEGIKARYGKRVLQPSGQIDRKALAGIIFRDDEERLAVNAIVHPLVKEEIKKRIGNSSKELVVVEAALLLEDHYNEFLDEIWYVYAPEEGRIERLIKSRSYTRQKALEIMGSQKSDEEFRQCCSVVIDNSRSLDCTLIQLKRILTDTGIKERG